ncbi:F-box and wd domain protein [Zalerion maritima]|uniref:F-box and wd domain protein n=1 Tax=Zalerion maritima TaxID=339359 RepID=A0AAD5WX61_9PEZI|nr:F-box and wd domain protein [Zalerion maritima]
MHQELTEISHHITQQASPVSTHPYQDGLQHHDLASSPRQPPVTLSGPPRGPSPASSRGSSRGSLRTGQPSSDQDSIRGLSPSLGPATARFGAAAGKRITDYENAMISSPKRPLGFKVTKSFNATAISLPELPDELWEHVMSNLDPKTHHAIAIVSRRFHRLSSTQRTWKMAFMSHFPGQKGLAASSGKDENQVTWYDASTPGQPSVRFFARISQMGSWREEYSLRTSLLRSLSKGKSESDFHACSARQKDKTHHFPTLSYWTKLNAPVTHLDAAFSDDPGKPPRAIHGSAASAESSIAVPLTGKVLRPPIFDLPTFQRWIQHTPQSVPYGLGDGPVFIPNVMDVSQRYGSISFSSFPGGQGGYLSPAGDTLWLGYSDNVPVYAPQISRSSDCITSAWIAKTTAIYTLTRGRIGLLTGSAMGFVSGYSFDSTVLPVLGMQPGFQPESVTWAVSPGVPIIAIKVDEEHNHKREKAGRSWAVALNALGEVYTLADVPEIQPLSTDTPWEAGRSAFWSIIPSTKRQPRLEDIDSANKAKALEISQKRTFSPQLPISSSNLSDKELKARSSKIDEFCQLPPSYFRDSCIGWDMRRRLEVDFAAGDGYTDLEQIFVLTCGHDAKKSPPEVCRYSKQVSLDVFPDAEEASHKSIFGPSTTSLVNSDVGILPSGGSAVTDSVSGTEWLVDSFSLESFKHHTITASALDTSNLALLTVPEEDLDDALIKSNLLPGRRGRWLAIGTDSGAIVVWNGRSVHSHTGDPIQPLRCIQTDSPEVSCLAVTALHVVHGGSDGRLQAWDPLGSTLDCVRVLNGKQKGSPLRTANANHMLPNLQPAVRSIYLDPDPTKLRGLASYGRVVRCWSYSAMTHASSRKRRHRFVDSHGRHVSRRQSGKVAGYIGAEQAELERERRELDRDRKYLRDRFILADLTEDEAILYAQLLSEEAAQQEDSRRTTDQDTSTSESVSLNETDSDAPSIFVSNEPGLGTLVDIAGPSNQHRSLPPLWTPARETSRDERSDTSSKEMELAIRLSLQDVDNQIGESSQVEAPAFTIDADPSTVPDGDDEESAVLASISEEEDIELRMALLASLQDSRRASQSAKGKTREQSPPKTPPYPPAPIYSEEEDRKMALELSRQEEERAGGSTGPVIDEQHFPGLGGSPAGKGRGKAGTPGLAGKGKKGKWVKWSP